jgi:hypothetical protein
LKLGEENEMAWKIPGRNDWQVQSEYEPLTVIGNVDGPDEGHYTSDPICEAADTEDGPAIAKFLTLAPDMYHELLDCRERLLVFLGASSETPRNVHPGVLGIDYLLDRAEGKLRIYNPQYYPLLAMKEGQAQNVKPCPDCVAARKHAYSDATTPGFFYTACDKHRGTVSVSGGMK